MKELVQILKNTRQHLMTGVSHMIPFVVAGGILLAVSVMLYGQGAVPNAAREHCGVGDHHGVNAGL